MVTTSTETLAAHVRGYAQAVRLHLDDLGPDVVDDLTDGLEADLTDSLLDRTATVPDAGRSPSAPGSPSGGVGSGAPGDAVLDLAAAFGPAAEYAAELRESAGLPPRAAQANRLARRWALGRAVVVAWELGSERWAHAWRPLTSTPAWAGFRDFVRSLAPVWWVLRGWAAAMVLMYPFGGTPAIWPWSTPGRIVLLAAVVVSIQWGRGRWLPRLSWAPGLLRVASVGAAVAVVPLLLYVSEDRPSDVGFSSYEAGWSDGYNEAQYSSVSDGGGYGDDTGVWVDGMQVSNLFVYDRNGDPIRDVQVFDDRGRPVRTMTAQGTAQTWTVPELPGDWFFQPAIASDGRERWNVYPLRAVDVNDVEWVPDESDPEWVTEVPRPLTGIQPTTMPWPFLKAPTDIPSKVVEPGTDETGTGDAGTQDPDAPATDAPAGTVPGGDRPASDTVPDEDPAPATVEATEAD
ncbi:hypothetical protein L1785_03420 [Antribacter sp. KLBMP9083]|uniref:Uncharacterized protein n=1 Tax=Antribacter soli TaxID=2910976 RepID=A0AA41QC08_9MICO|nr:hypothetical protein [Antribacter soli]MCF4120020.1 hypothetical protein [Antribacter soli]